MIALKMPSNLVFIRTSDAENFMVKALRMNSSEEPFWLISSHEEARSRKNVQHIEKAKSSEVGDETRRPLSTV